MAVGAGHFSGGNILDGNANPITAYWLPAMDFRSTVDRGRSANHNAYCFTTRIQTIWIRESHGHLYIMWSLRVSREKR